MDPLSLRGFLPITLCCLLMAGCASRSSNQDQDWAYRALEHSKSQYTLLAHQLPRGQYPRSLDEEGSLVTNQSGSWISGFFPGTLWYLYEHSQEAAIQDYAADWTRDLESQKNNTGTHDLGFIFVPSYGNAYRISGDTDYRDVLLTSAQSLSQRFDPTVGCIKSWDFFNGPDKWKQYPVIIDNMMNLELLFEASRLSGDSTYHRMAVSHADKTLKNHIRPDYSTYHVVDYDTLTGGVIKKMTSQGLADESTWARGQAWAVAGFTICYRYTQDPKYLTAAIALYDHYSQHENMPGDHIPYWDFDDPDIPRTSRDASAAAIIATSLIELSEYVDSKRARKYRDEAETILRTLSSPAYLTESGGSEGFILKHSTGHRPLESEIDVPICYADYYFVKALTDYLKRSAPTASPARVSSK